MTTVLDHQGPANPHWKGGRIWRGGGSNAYPCVLVNGRYIPEHRLIAERLIGRKLHPRERVYHRDLDITNNSPANLVVVTASVYGQLRQTSTRLR